MSQDSEQNQGFLEKVDIFGIGIAIRFSHLPRHNTRFGGLITISILSIIFFQLVGVLIDIFTYRSPQVIQSDGYVYEPEPFQITPQTFNIAMGLQDKKFDQFMDERMYHVQATQQTLQKVFNSTTNQYDPVWTFQPLNLQTCTENNFQIKDVKKYFLGVSYPLMYCFDVNENRASIEGEFSASIYKAIEIDFIECVGDEKCASEEEKKTYLTNPTLGIFFSNNIVQIQDKQNPFQVVGKNLYWMNGPSLQKYITLNLMNTKINSDFSLFGSSKTTQRVVQYSSYQEQVLPRTSPVIFKLVLVYEKNREMNYYRKYTKVDEAFSQIGGMFNILLTAGFIICKPISQLELNRKLLNSIFNISDGNSKEDKSDKSQEKGQSYLKNSLIEDQKERKNSHLIKSEQNSSKSIQINKKKKSLLQRDSIFSQRNTIKEQNVEANCYIKQFFNIKFSELQIYIKDYLLYYLSYFKCFQTRKQKLIKFGTNKLYNYLDVHYLINKMIEIEKLKHLLLNENQIKLFEYLPRPVLKIKETDQDASSISPTLKSPNPENQKILEIQEQIKEFNPKNKIQQNKIEQVKFSYFDNEEKTQLEKAYDAQKAFNIIINEPKKSKLDEKLIRMLDTKLTNLFADNSFELNSAKEIEENHKNSENKDFENMNTSFLTRPKKKSMFNLSFNSKILSKEEQQKLDQSTETQEPQIQRLSKFQSNRYIYEEEEQCQTIQDVKESEKDLKIKKNKNLLTIPYHQEISFKIKQKQLDDD